MRGSLILLTFCLGLGIAPAAAAPVISTERVVAGVPVRVVTIDLRDPHTVLDLVLAGDRPAQGPPRGQAPFSTFVRKAPAATLMNGTFFSMDAEKRLMGTMVQTGRLVHHVSFRPHGTTFGLLPGNRPELVPAGQSDWRRYWITLTAGPRLLTDGRPVIRPAAEGFTDPAVVRPATRSALGFTRDGRTLYMVSFHAAVGLAREAAVMQALGCYQALNLDGGTCRALAERGRVRVAPGRPLTNAIAVYDTHSRAPAPVASAFRSFTYNREGPPPLNLAGQVLDPGPFLCGRRTPVKVVGSARPYNFEGWDFTRLAGRPVVSNDDGWLELKGQGAIATPWPTSGGTLSLLARRLGPFMGFHLGRTGLWLDISPRGWTLRHGDKPLAQRTGEVDGARHLYSFTWRPGTLSIHLDGRPLLSGPLPRPPGSLGLSGHGAFKSLNASQPR